MADLDTRSKRASSVQIFLPFVLSPVLPDGTINQGDRQHTAMSYSGIAASGGSPSISGLLTAGKLIHSILQGRLSQ